MSPHRDRPRLATAAIGLAVTLLSLPACSRQYVAEVFNGTASTVTMRLVTDRVRPETLVERSVSPNEFARLGPVDAPITEAVLLTASDPTDPGSPPAEQSVSPGLNELELYTTQGWGELRFRVLRLGGREAPE